MVYALVLCGGVKVFLANFLDVIVGNLAAGFDIFGVDCQVFQAIIFVQIFFIDAVRGRCYVRVNRNYIANLLAIFQVIRVSEILTLISAVVFGDIQVVVTIR